MNTPSQTYFILLKKFVNMIDLYIASLDVDSYLLTFHWTNPPIFAFIVCIKMMRTALRSLRMFFLICLLWPPKIRFHV